MIGVNVSSGCQRLWPQRSRMDTRDLQRKTSGLICPRSGSRHRITDAASRAFPSTPEHIHWSPAMCWRAVKVIWCFSSLSLSIFLCVITVISPVTSDLTSETALCDCAETNGFSEEELLNITFEACDTTGKGKIFSLNSDVDALGLLHSRLKKNRMRRSPLKSGSNCF